METKNLVGSLIGITVAVLMVAVILMPIVEESATNKSTFVNEGPLMEEIHEGTTTVAFDGTTWSYNGEEFTPNIPSGDSVVATFWDDGIYRSLVGGTIFQFSGATIVQNVNSFTLTMNDGNATLDYATPSSSATSTFTYTKGLVLSPNGEYSFVTEGRYALGTTLLYDEEIGRVSTGDTTFIYTPITIQGTIEGGFTGSAINSAVTVNSVTATTSEVSGYDELYQIGTFTANVTYSDNSTTYDTTLTFTQLIAPAEIIADKTGAVSDDVASLITVIPVLVLVGIVVGAVGMVVKRED